jgi:hypothetical protein
MHDEHFSTRPVGRFSAFQLFSFLFCLVAERALDEAAYPTMSLLSQMIPINQ